MIALKEYDEAEGICKDYPRTLVKEPDLRADRQVREPPAAQDV